MLTYVPTKKSSFKFFDFFNKNKEDVERILWSVCWARQNRYDPEDMFSELILRLHRSKFYEQFNPKKKTAFSSYFIMKVNRYADHIVEYYERRQIIDCMALRVPLQYNGEGEKEYPGGRVFFREINGEATDSLENIKELQSDENVSDQVAFNEMVEKTKKMLQKKELTAFDLLLIDSEVKRIAEILGCSNAFVTQLKKKIGARLEKILNRKKK